jgi:hypothetical protein
MVRRVSGSLVVGLCLASLPAAAQATPAAPDEASAVEAPETEGATPPASPTPAQALPASGEPAQPTVEDPAAKTPSGLPAGWHTEITGYFRAPMALGISERPGPDNMTGPSSLQVSYGPNRTIDWNYYSFAYTRLQEEDWAEFYIHEKKKHVDAAVGWMGYWFQGAGFRNPDASWAPGLAYVAFDSDFRLGDNPGASSNKVVFTMGSWWPKFGYFEKYDTYTLGRFRQLGEQLELTVPLDPYLTDYSVVLTEGFGTNRDGSFNYGSPPFYGAIVGLDLITWLNAQLVYSRYFDLGLHFNTEWTSDPNLEQQSAPGAKSYGAAADAHLTVAGAEMNVRIPRLGHLWLSPSYISVRNGWALASAGTEVMNSLGGAGIATNYMAWTNSTSDSTGTGSMLNFGFLYENSLSGIEGKAAGSVLPELVFSIFGLYAGSSLDLPSTTSLTQSRLKQFKWGADATLYPLTWLGFMLRGDIVEYDIGYGGYIFAAATARVVVSSHFLSSERIYLQYSRYKYGDKMVLNGDWPWNAPLVAGSNVLQEGPYSGMTPDQNVVKMQAEIAF